MIEYVGQLPQAVVDRLGDNVKWKETFKSKWIGGYHFMLDNGFVISVQFAPGFFGDYRWQWIIDRMADGLSLQDVYDGEYDFSDSKTAEIVIMKDGDWYNVENMLPESDDEHILIDEKCIVEYATAAEIFRLIVKFAGVVFIGAR